MLDETRASFGSHNGTYAGEQRSSLTSIVVVRPTNPSISGITGVGRIGVYRRPVCLILLYTQVLYIIGGRETRAPHHRNRSKRCCPVDNDDFGEVSASGMPDLHGAFKRIPIDLIISDDFPRGDEDLRMYDHPLREDEPLSPKEIRTHAGNEALQGLAASIGHLGLLSPIHVREDRDGKFRIVAGRRRLAAAKTIPGVTEIPAFVIDAENERGLLLAFIENAQRENLDPVETGDAINFLCTLHGWMYKGKPNVNRFSRETGMPETNVRQYLQIRRVSNDMRRAIKSEQVPMMAGVEVGSLPHRFQRGLAWTYIQSVVDPTLKQISEFCSQIRPLMDEDTPFGQGIMLDMYAILRTAVQSQPMTDYGKTFLLRIEYAQRMKLRNADEDLGLPPDTGDDALISLWESEDLDPGSVSDEYFASLLDPKQPRAAKSYTREPSDPFPELQTLPAVPTGKKSLAAVIKSYIAILSNSSDPEHQLAARVLGRVYNAAVLKVGQIPEESSEDAEPREE